MRDLVAKEDGKEANLRTNGRLRHIYPNTIGYMKLLIKFNNISEFCEQYCASYIYVIHMYVCTYVEFTSYVYVFLCASVDQQQQEMVLFTHNTISWVGGGQTQIVYIAKPYTDMFMQFCLEGWDLVAKQKSMYVHVCIYCT